jgi:hypothetical protein
MESSTDVMSVWFYMGLHSVIRMMDVRPVQDHPLDLVIKQYKSKPIMNMSSGLVPFLGHACFDVYNCFYQIFH